jgi:hypothetical protein
MFTLNIHHNKTHHLKKNIACYSRSTWEGKNIELRCALRNEELPYDGVFACNKIHILE